MTTPELTKWLRDNSSGVYHPAAEAADLIERMVGAIERIVTDASTIQYLSYGEDGDSGAIRIAERIEYECDQILQVNDQSPDAGATE